MTNTAQNWAWTIKGLKPATKLLLVKIADYSNEHGQSWPSQQLLATMCEISIRSVIDHIALLEDRGIITVTRRTTDEGYRTSNLYTLPPQAREDGTAIPAPRPKAAAGDVNEDGGADSAPRDYAGTEFAGAYVQTKVQTTALTGEPISFDPIPLTPAQRGKPILPFDKVLRAIGDRVLASEETRACSLHRRQRRSCLACWTPRPLSRDDVPWCGDTACDPTTRLRELRPTGPGSHGAMTRCPECHPLALTADRVAELQAAR